MSDRELVSISHLIDTWPAAIILHAANFSGYKGIFAIPLGDVFACPICYGFPTATMISLLHAYSLLLLSRKYSRSYSVSYLCFSRARCGPLASPSDYCIPQSAQEAAQGSIQKKASQVLLILQQVCAFKQVNCY
jgi:hypothetical protein